MSSANFAGDGFAPEGFASGGFAAIATALFVASFAIGGTETSLQQQQSP